jgi:hypothetical protein
VKIEIDEMKWAGRVGKFLGWLLGNFFGGMILAVGFFLMWSHLNPNQ